MSSPMIFKLSSINHRIFKFSRFYPTIQRNFISNKLAQPSSVLGSRSFTSTNFYSNDAGAPPIEKTSSSSTNSATVQNISSNIVQSPPSCPDRLLERVVVECQCNEKAVLKSYAHFITMTCKLLDIDMLPLEYPTPVYQRMTVLKSVHIHKKHRVQYEMRTHFLRLTMHHLTGSTADTVMEYIQRMCPEGVAMHVTEFELKKFPPAVQEVLDNIKKQRDSSSETST